MTGELLPLREAARELGVTAKTLRNAWARRRAGLPAGPWAGLEAVQIAGRLYVTRAALERFRATLTAPQAPAPGSLRAELEALAEDLARHEPGAALRLRALAERAGPPVQGPEHVGRIALRVLAKAAQTEGADL